MPPPDAHLDPLTHFSVQRLKAKFHRKTKCDMEPGALRFHGPVEVVEKARNVSRDRLVAPPATNCGVENEVLDSIVEKFFLPNGFLGHLILKFQSSFHCPGNFRAAGEFLLASLPNFRKSSVTTRAGFYCPSCGGIAEDFRVLPYPPRLTPAMAAGLADHVWSPGETARLVGGNSN